MSFSILALSLHPASSSDLTSDDDTVYGFEYPCPLTPSRKLKRPCLGRRRYLRARVSSLRLHRFDERNSHRITTLLTDSSILALSLRPAGLSNLVPNDHAAYGLVILTLFTPSP
ncbi:hypothetical protein CDL15_Pgr003016 [Punica granatum]|nr:hypothetical protein CDL15_Pgr003016 [Punica granatum]